LDPSLRLHLHTELDHQVELVVPGRSYSSAGPPLLFNYTTRDDVVLSWFQREIQRTAIACPDEYVIRLRDVNVVHGHYLIQSPGQPLADTFNFDVSAVDRPVIAAIGAQIRRGEVQRVAPTGLPVVHIFKDIYHNFGHCLAEVLPKLMHLRAMGLHRFTLLFPWASLMHLAMVQHAAAVLGLSFDHVVCYNNQVHQVDEVLWVGPVAKHDFRKSQTFRELAQALTAAVPPGDGPRRVYVARPPGSARPILQAPALEALARDRGYAVVEPSTLSFADQIALFHRADHVLGPMGAALTNTVFMRPGTRVSMLTTRRIDPFFFDIARLIGLDFDWVFTQPAEAWTNLMQTEPWDVDPARFAGLLPWLE